MSDFGSELHTGKGSSYVGETMVLPKIPERNGEKLVPTRITMKFMGEHPNVAEEQKFGDMGEADQLRLLAAVGTVLQQSEIPFKQAVVDSVGGVTVSMRVFDHAPLFTDKRPVVLPDVLVNIVPAGVALLDERGPKPEDLHLERSDDGELVVITGTTKENSLSFGGAFPDVQQKFNARPDGDRMKGHLNGVLLDVGLRQMDRKKLSQVKMK